jgi:hypothetical protein
MCGAERIAPRRRPGTIGVSIRHEESHMKKLLTLGAAAVAAISVGAGVATAGSTKPAAVKTVTIVMHDPGCHWFLVGGKYKRTLSVSGPVIMLKNVDEAALKVAGPGGLKLDKVGQSLGLARGVYHITMVGQKPDDNHLLLTVK